MRAFLEPGAESLRLKLAAGRAGLDHVITLARVQRPGLAVSGYLAFAPDSLSPFGGYPGDEDKARDMFAKQDRTKMIEDLLNAVPYLKSRPDTTGKIGAVGFCFGGGVVNAMAVRYPDLAAVPKPCDVALIALSSTNVAPAIEQCGKAGIPFALVLAGGFSEIGAEGKALQESLIETARKATTAS